MLRKSIQISLPPQRRVVDIMFHLHPGPIARQWTPAMEKRIQEYSAQGMDVNDITTELFHEFAKPESGYWQETYRKVQEMKLEGKLA